MTTNDRSRQASDRSPQNLPIPSNGLPHYPGMKRKLNIIKVRQQIRALCDATGLGPSTGERICCALIVGVVPFVASFALAFAVREPAGYATLQGISAFLIVSVSCILLIGWASDEALETARATLAAALPHVKAAWEASRVVKPNDEKPATVEPIADVLAVRNTTKRCPFCAETIQANANKCRHCGEMIGAMREASGRQTQQVTVHVHAPKSNGAAVVLAVIFGIFSIFGIGHMYIGRVATGLLLMFGYWLFLAVNYALVFCTCGLWYFPALVIIPSVWFLLILISSVHVASSID